MKIQWIFYNIALPSSGLVTVIYWGLFYTGEDITYNNIAVHVINFVLMFTEQYISSVNTRILHIYQTIIFGTAYVLFTVILWSTTGKIYYAIIDWETSPGLATGVVFGIIATYIIAQFLLFLISYGLKACAKRYELVETDFEA